MQRAADELCRLADGLPFEIDAPWDAPEWFLEEILVWLDALMEGRTSWLYDGDVTLPCEATLFASYDPNRFPEEAIIKIGYQQEPVQIDGCDYLKWKI